MEDEVVLKQMKKYRTFSIVGIFLFIALLVLQYIIIDINTPNCSAPTSITTQEIDAFNMQFASYEGNEVPGSNVRVLLSKLAASAESYRDEEDKVPSISYESSDNIALMNYKIGKIQDYKAFANEIRNGIKPKENYKVEVEYASTGLLRLVRIVHLDGETVEGNSIIVELEEN